MGRTIGEALTTEDFDSVRGELTERNRVAGRALPALPAARARRRLSEPALFELDDVAVRRGGRPVLSGVDLTLGEGVTAVLGPSGAGKSSLLRLLCRLADADEGEVRFRGDDVRELDPLGLRRRACLVPQLPAPVDGQRGRERVAAGRGWPAGEPTWVGRWSRPGWTPRLPTGAPSGCRWASSSG